MTNDRLSELLRDANPVTREPTRPIDDAWDDIVAGLNRVQSSSMPTRRRFKLLRTRSR
jgi:hypothetical protein